MVGTETYVVGISKEKSNLEVAKRENQVITLEENYEEHYHGFDPNSPDIMVGLTMMQQEYLDNSILFADLVQKQFTFRVSRNNRGVKQGGYWVISYTLMPSVLIELGFISNASEEIFLNSKEGQIYMASAIYRAFKAYKTKLEGVDSSKKSPLASGKSNGKSSKSKPSKADMVSGLEYRVQILISSRKIELTKANFKNYDDISRGKKGGKYAYYIGHIPTFEAAIGFQRELREVDFKDCFMVAFYKGKEISLHDAEIVVNSKN